MRIEDITRESLAKAPNRELLALRLRQIQLWNKNFKDNDKVVVGSLNRSDFLAKYRLLLREYNKRKLEHSTEDIDRAAFKRSMEIAKIGFDISMLDTMVVVPDYVSLVGSGVSNLNDANDVDILLREDERNRDTGLELKLVRTLDKQDTLAKKGKEFIYSTKGPHATYLPLYDLVLRPKSELNKVVVEEDYKKSLQEYYDGLDEWSDDFEVEYRELTKYLQGDTVLSLGCGTGRLEKRLSSIYRVTGVDKEDLAVKMSKAKGLKVSKLDIEKEELPYEAGGFDNVIGVHLLEHLDDPVAILQKSRQIAKRACVFIVPLGKRFDPTHKQEYDSVDQLEEDLIKPSKLSSCVKVRKIQDTNTAVIVVDAKKSRLRPFGRYIPPKPAMSNITEAFKYEDIQDWVEKRWPVDVEEKLNGFRVIAEKKDNKLAIWTEGRKNRTKQFAELREVLEQIPDDFILDMSIGINKGTKPLPRIQLMTLMSDELELDEDEYIVAACFDLPYWKTDKHLVPLEERRKLLEEFFGKYLKGSRNFTLTHFRIAKNRMQLTKAFEDLSKLPQSEGVVIKALDSIWDTDGSAEDWSKIKLEAEIKVIVLDVHKTKAGTYNYTVGVLAGDSSYTNTKEIGGETYVVLGKTFNTKLKANVGDILTVGVEEIIARDELDWLGPRVIDIDSDRSTPYYANQVVALASRGNILQKAEVEGNIDYKVGDTGKGVLQLHVMGIEEKYIDALKEHAKEIFEARHDYLKLQKILKETIGEQACHLDLRLVREGDDYFEGGEIMVGNISGLTKLRKLLEDKAKLRFGWKTPHVEDPTAETIRGPVSWMDVGKDRVEIIEPGEVGAFANTYSIMIALDYFDFEMIQSDKHAKKIKLTGCKVLTDGVYLFAYVPVKEGRVWMISKLDIEKYVPIFIKKADEQIVCGVVYEPDTVDAQGDSASEEEIRKAAYYFMEHAQQYKLNHHGRPIKAKVLESYIAPQDLVIAGQKVKKGSWLLTTKILDKDAWEAVKAGKLIGYSMAGYAEAV